ncbi:MAG: response regulator [Desulfovibrionales bacterium]|nr:response regulator [Desulfovibrionales bacterium]
MHILLVEDDRINSIAGAGVLKKLGHRVSTARNGLEAIESARTTQFDLILMDIQMPIMDGLQAAQHIRSSTDLACPPDIPIVALTAHAMRGEKDVFLQAGLDAYVSKPLHPKELERVITSFMQ